MYKNTEYQYIGRTCSKTTQVETPFFDILEENSGNYLTVKKSLQCTLLVAWLQRYFTYLRVNFNGQPNEFTSAVTTAFSMTVLIPFMLDRYW